MPEFSEPDPGNIKPAAKTLALFQFACTVRAPEDWKTRADLLAGADADAWQWILAASAVHGLSGLLARNLEWVAQALAVSVPILDTLAARRRSLLAQLLARRAAARAAMDALERGNIPFVLFKGLALSEEVYGDLSLRQFGDCDLLVAEDEAEAAVRALNGAGFRTGRLGGVASYRGRGHHAVPLLNEKGEAVDLHWELTGREFHPEPNDIVWAHTFAPPAARLPGLRFTPEMNFVYLATHFYWDSFSIFKSMLDAYVAVRAAGDGIDVERTIALAGALGRLKIVRLTARLCERDFPSLPFFARLGAPPGGAQAALAMRVLSPGRLLRLAAPHHDPSPLFRLALAGTRQTASNAARQTLLPTRRELAERFGRPFRPSMYPVYYGRQAFRVLTSSRRSFAEFDS